MNPIVSFFDLKDLLCLPDNLKDPLILLFFLSTLLITTFGSVYFRTKWVRLLRKINSPFSIEGEFPNEAKEGELISGKILLKNQSLEFFEDHIKIIGGKIHSFLKKNETEYKIEIQVDKPALEKLIINIAENQFSGINNTKNNLFYLEIPVLNLITPLYIKMTLENQSQENEFITVKALFNDKCPDFSKKHIVVTGGNIVDFQIHDGGNFFIFKIQTDKNLSETLSVKIPENLFKSLNGSENPSSQLDINLKKEPLSKGPFDFLSAPKGDWAAVKCFNQIRGEMNDVFKQAKEKFGKGELGLIGAGQIYPRILKLSGMNQIGTVYCKSIDNFNDSDHWYFIGDIHGDFLAFYSVLEDIKKDPDFKICFLGDLVDRGPYGAECFALLLKMAMEFPNRIIWILGNHDDVVKWKLGVPKGVFDKDIHDSFLKIRDSLPRFYSFVEPAEFLVWLNDRNPQVKQDRLLAGNLFCEIVSVLPRCVLFPNGLLATHAGFPLKDRWDSLKTLEDFHHQRCLDDFTWNRIQNNSDAFISKDMRASEKSWTFGWDTIANFRDKVKDIFDFKCLIRGHDHLKEGWEIHQNFVKVPVLTLNCFGFNNLNNSLEKGAYKNEVVYFKADTNGGINLKNIIKIPINSNLLEDFYEYQ